MRHLARYGNNFKFQFRVKHPRGSLLVECAGFTATPYTTMTRGRGDYAFEVQRANFDADAPTLHGKFLYAERFMTEAQAALECDFWKLVLSQVYYVCGLSFSHGTRSAYLDAARSNGLNVKSRLDDRQLWGQELLYFVSCHERELSQCRDVGTPDTALAESLQASSQPVLRTWAQQRLAAEELHGAANRWGLSHKIHRVEIMLNYERMVQASCREVRAGFCRAPESKPNPTIAALTEEAQTLFTKLPEAFLPVREFLHRLKEFQTRVETECAHLDNNRPTIEGKESEHYQEDVS